MPDRSTPPPFVRSLSFELATPDVRNLPNGINAFFIGGGSQDVLKIEFIFQAGRWVENKRTASHFTAQLLSKGTHLRNSFEIANIFDQYGAHLDISPGLDFVSVNVHTLRKNTGVVLELLMEILSTPTFPEGEFSQARSVFIQNLQVSNEKTSFVASQLFRKNLYGAGHPYGAIVQEEDPEHLDVDDLKHHFNTHFRAPSVYVSGKVDDNDKQVMLDHFSRYRQGIVQDSPRHEITRGPERASLEKEGSIQSSIRLGRRSILRSHPDYAPILFVSHILGGYFGSRLMKNIREDKGLTYGISASIHGLKEDSFLIIGADVNRENTELAFTEIRKELKELRSAPVPADELETTRNHFIGSLQAELTTPFAHADKIKTITLHDLPWDHYRRLIVRIDSMTPAEILRISDEYFHEESLIQVAVG